jgi:hypothetical protein
MVRLRSFQLGMVVSGLMVMDSAPGRAARDNSDGIISLPDPTEPCPQVARTAVVPGAEGDHQHLGVIEPDDLVLLGLDRRHDVAHPVTTAHPFGPDCAFS